MDLDILSEIFESEQGYISFKDEEEYKSLSLQLIEELESGSIYSFKKIDVSIKDELYKRIYYTTYRHGYNMICGFVNDKLSTCEFTWEDETDVDICFKHIQSTIVDGIIRNYDRTTKLDIDGTIDFPSYIEYFDNGALSSLGYYRKGSFYRIDHTKPAWLSYNPKGELVTEVYYKDGKIHNENGYARVHYVRGELDDINCKYFINGKQLTKKEWFQMTLEPLEKKIYKLTPEEEKKFINISHLCKYCTNTFATKYKLQDHYKICGGKRLLDNNKELNVFLSCSRYYKEIFDFVAQRAAAERDFELLKIMKENGL